MNSVEFKVRAVCREWRVPCCVTLSGDVIVGERRYSTWSMVQAQDILAEHEAIVRSARQLKQVRLNFERVRSNRKG